MTSPDVQAGDGFYASRERIFPREVSGRFQRLRTLAVWVLLGLYYALPWLQWGGRQAVLFDLPARQFHIFSLTLWPQDFYFLTWLMVLMALSLFFFTALAGRLFCGFACPQTVWTETFLAIERLVEGSRSQQIKLAGAPWTPAKIARRSAKHALWISFALWTGFTFVGYFTPIRELVAKIFSLGTGPWETFWVLFYGAATYVNAGFMREQVCKYMCPYARFQSAMFDRDTWIVTYDSARGEPRGARRRGVDPRASGLGDCVDCTMCVQVCPTGIDIRKGLQYECIACAACIDACDTVMDKIGYPRGLIRYDTHNGLAGKPRRVLRPRIVIYGSLLAVLAAGFVVALARRDVVAIDVIRDRNALYRERADGRIENVYDVRIMNKDSADHEFVASVAGLPGVEISSGAGPYAVRAGELRSVALRISAPAGELRGGTDLVVEVHATDRPGLATSGRARFIAPASP